MVLSLCCISAESTPILEPEGATELKQSDEGLCFVVYCRNMSLAMCDV